MWFGTNNGLNRYDGEKFKIFRNIWGDPNSLCYNYIFNIAEIDNKILVGTQKGIMYYNYPDSKFYPIYYQPYSGGKSVKITCNINSLVTDKAGNAYIATDKLGLLLYNKLHNACKQLLLNGTVANYDASSATLDDNNRLWFFVKDTGVCYYDITTGKLNVITSQLKSASCLLKDQHNNIWIGTDGGGLYIYNLITTKLVKFNDVYGRLTSDNIVFLKIMRSGDLWIGTNGGGINIINLKNHQFNYLVPGEEKGSLSSGAISYLYEDNESRKWIATLRGGINIIESKEQPFRLFTHDPFNKNSVVNNFIKSFCEDEVNNIWIGTDGSGLSYWNTKNNTYVSYVHSGNPTSLSSNFVVSVLNDYKNQIWVATFNGGIDAFDKNTKTFKHYTCYNPVDKKDEKTLWILYEDHQKNLWAGCTRNGALYLFNRAKDKFELFDKNLVNIHALYEDSAGNLWGGDYSRLIKINRNGGKHEYHNIDYAVRTITEDKNNNLWLGTDGGGLLLFNRANNTYKRFTEIDGLPSNSLLDLLIDNKGIIWGSTYNGLTSFNPKSKTFKNYNASDGLQSNQFNYNAALKLNSGQMIFGGINGFNLFNPDSIKVAVHQPVLRFTDLRINNVPIESNNAFTNNEPVINLKKIIVPYNQATFSLDYTALEYSFPDKINYAYYLENWDHNWNYVGKLKTAYYTRLNEGSYTLRIKATNTEGQWDGKQLVIAITVLPPWYRTWWAYLLYLLVIGTIVYWFWLYRSRQTKLKYEVEFANMRVEREKELNEKKLSFFTNVSHEFRTPLTLIINPLKDLLNNNKGETEELNVVYRNARRLLGLVDHLLLFRKAESENNQMKVSKTDFVNLCNDVFLCFTQQAKLKRITYRLESVSEKMEVYADIEKLEIALFNLVSNAIKFTPEGGDITVVVDEDEQNVYFKIADNGIGINTDVGDKLFDKFYQVKERNYFKTGFGIGLYLVKVFIENHKGHIDYHNNPNGGTTFELSLPKGSSHFSADQLYESNIYEPTHVNELIDYDNKDQALKADDVNNLELLISDKQSVIIIDDNNEIRGYIKKLFAAEYTVFETDNAKHGLELIKTHLPDLIISDIVMSEMDGLELCKIVKQDSATNHIPIILLTGDATPDIMLKSIEEGAVDFMSKPFEKEILIAKVKSILRSKTELQNYFYKEITLKNSTRNISEENKNFLYNCIAIIEGHLMDASFDVDTLAKKVGLSYPTLFKRIKAITGQSINNFIRFVRLRKAAELLIHTNCNVNEAAYQVGFNDIKYFREHFHKQFGINPSEFIKKHRANFQITYRMN